MKRKPELLCPVGGQDTLSAAIRGGADAVYFGAREFNARMNAKNFDRLGLEKAISFCHEKGVRTYITLNTLLTDRKLSEALDLVSFLYRAGADALIVADLGLAHLVKEAFPDLELHASTQLSGHNSDAAAALEKFGFSRMVCARELDRENIRTLCRSSCLEIEMFIHGAICASHSGQCLMSSMIGDRSGNRGECAQPCRLPYNGTYPLSLKDLCLAGHVKEILDLGVSSLKIEGRMKSPEYVSTVSRIWRKLLDEERDATPKEMQQLAGIFSRSGFTDGYFTGRRTPSMLGVRTQKDKTATQQTQVSFSDVGRRAPAIQIERKAVSAPEISLPGKGKVPFARSARFLSASQIPDTDFFHQIYLPLFSFDGKKANGVVLPSVILDSEKASVRARLEQAVEQGAKHVLIGNVGHFEPVRSLPVTLHGDFRLNLTNSFSLSMYPELADLIVSPELNLAQLRDLRGKKSVIVYGKLPLMLLEKPVGVRTLRDRRGVVFPVVREGERDLVLNSVPIYMLDREKELKERGLFSQHYLFTTESRAEIEAILFARQQKREPNFSVKRIK